jgi:D-glycero-D-manno-heptose 1,7-bisphosphate phosphatase
MTIAVFLDRDGTLNEEIGYIRDVADLRLISGAARAVTKLNDANIYAILASNQSGPARGYYDETHVQALHHQLANLLRDESGAWLDAVFYSPYLPEGSVPQYAQASRCRKPDIGMIEQALAQFTDIDLARSYVIGDKATDIVFAKNAGCKGILVRTGYGEDVLQGRYQELEHSPYWICRDVGDAVNRILQEVEGA